MGFGCRMSGLGILCSIMRVRCGLRAYRFFVNPRCLSGFRVQDLGLRVRLCSHRMLHVCRVR